MNFDYDYLIVGSGFGGAVSALRLAEKGWKVGVVEQGRRVRPDDITYRRRLFGLLPAGLATTAHILSGCPLGRSATDSVIDSRHQVHGHPGLHVVDGSSIPANIGVNPSLTITAMAERFAALQPAASEEHSI